MRLKAVLGDDDDFVGPGLVGPVKGPSEAFFGAKAEAARREPDGEQSRPALPGS